MSSASWAAAGTFFAIVGTQLWIQAGCLASPPAAMDLSGLVAQLDAAYAQSAPYEVEVAEYPWGNENDAPTIDEVAGLRREDAARYLTIKVHPTLGRVFDFSHPLQRLDARRISGYVETGGARYKVDSTGVAAERKVMTDDAMGASCARLVPTCLATWVRRLAASEPSGTVSNRKDGMVEVDFSRQGIGFVVDPRDFTILEFSEISSSSNIVTTFLAFQPTAVMKARFPAVAMQDFRSTPPGERPSRGRTIRKFAILQTGGMPSEDFAWWTYVNKAIDKDTGEEFGPENVSLSSRSDAGRDAVQEVEIDRKTRTQNQLDARRPVLPREKNTAGAVLYVLGAAMLVLALAWWVRRRLSCR